MNEGSCSGEIGESFGRAADERQRLSSTRGGFGAFCFQPQHYVQVVKIQLRLRPSWVDVREDI